MPKSTPLEQLGDDLAVGAELLINFPNRNLDIEEELQFKVLAEYDEKPKANAVVLIRHQNQ